MKEVGSGPPRSVPRPASVLLRTRALDELRARKGRAALARQRRRQRRWTSRTCPPSSAPSRARRALPTSQATPPSSRRSTRRPVRPSSTRPRPPRALARASRELTPLTDRLTDRPVGRLLRCAPADGARAFAYARRTGPRRARHEERDGLALAGEVVRPPPPFPPCIALSQAPPSPQS